MELQNIPWAEYPPGWLITPDWLLDWIRDGSKPNPVWAFSTCYSAYYRVGISPFVDAASKTTVDSEGITVTEDAWLSFCTYHRYEDRYGNKYPLSLANWCQNGERQDRIALISPHRCETIDRIVCSRVAHNTTVQAEINQLRNPDSAAQAPALA
jgi:hypothetical protein